jgi:hypothetical protein
MPSLPPSAFMACSGTALPFAVYEAPYYAVFSSLFFRPLISNCRFEYQASNLISLNPLLQQEISFRTHTNQQETEVEKSFYINKYVVTGKILQKYPVIFHAQVLSFPVFVLTS